jgi:hypothetical protein
MGLCLNNAVFDIKNGTLLKLAEGREVSHAMKGLQKLSRQEINNLYGNPPIYKEFQFGKITNMSPEGGYLSLNGFMETSYAAVLCQVVELIDSKIVKDKEY